MTPSVQPSDLNLLDRKKRQDELLSRLTNASTSPLDKYLNRNIVGSTFNFQERLLRKDDDF